MFIICGRIPTEAQCMQGPRVECDDRRACGNVQGSARERAQRSQEVHDAIELFIGAGAWASGDGYWVVVSRSGDI